MTSRIAIAFLATALGAWPADWAKEADRAFDSARYQEAAADYTRALAEDPGKSLHLRISLATAYLELGDYRSAEATLRAIPAPKLTELEQAEIWNARSALHLKLGRMADAETDLLQALNLAGQGELRATVLHN